MMPTDVLLSVVISVAGCLNPISSSVVRIGTADFAVLKALAVSDSCADDTTTSMIFDSAKMGALSGGSSSLVDR